MAQIPTLKAEIKSVTLNHNTRNRQLKELADDGWNLVAVVVDQTDFHKPHIAYVTRMVGK
jgi:hypothetical protein